MSRRGAQVLNNETIKLCDILVHGFFFSPVAKWPRRKTACCIGDKTNGQASFSGADNIDNEIVNNQDAHETRSSNLFQSAVIRKCPITLFTKRVCRRVSQMLRWKKGK